MLEMIFVGPGEMQGLEEALDSLQILAEARFALRPVTATNG